MKTRRPFYLEFEQAVLLARLSKARLENSDIRNMILSRAYNFIDFVIRNTLSHFRVANDKDDLSADLWARIIANWYPRVDWYRAVGEIITYLITTVRGYAKNLFRNQAKRVDARCVAPEDFEIIDYENPASTILQQETNEKILALADWINWSDDEECSRLVAGILGQRLEGVHHGSTLRRLGGLPLPYDDEDGEEEPLPTGTVLFVWQQN